MSTRCLQPEVKTHQDPIPFRLRLPPYLKSNGGSFAARRHRVSAAGAFPKQLPTGWHLIVAVTHTPPTQPRATRPLALMGNARNRLRPPALFHSGFVTLPAARQSSKTANVASTHPSLAEFSRSPPRPSIPRPHVLLMNHLRRLLRPGSRASETAACCAGTTSPPPTSFSNPRIQIPNQLSRLKPFVAHAGRSTVPLAELALLPW